MSEFCANGNFLDRNHFFTKYYLLIKDISFGASDVESAMNKLKNYSGFGIETQIANLKKCYTQLRDYKEDVRTEFYSLVKIVDTINDCENSAKGIFCGDTSSSVNYISTDFKKYESYKPYFFIWKTWKQFLDTFFDVSDTAGGLIGFLSEFEKILDNSNWNWCGTFSNADTLSGMKTIFNGVNILKYAYETYDKFSDGKISTSELLKITKNSFSTFKSFGKILEKIYDVKIFPDVFPQKDGTAVKDTIKIFNDGNTTWGKITSWLPFVSTVFSTSIGFYDKYSEYTEDGEYTLAEKCKTACYGSLKGLSSIATNIPIVGTIWGIVDTALQVNDCDVAEKVNDAIFNTIDDEFYDAKNLLIEKGKADEGFCIKYYNASNFERNLINYSILCQDIVNKANHFIF